MGPCSYMAMFKSLFLLSTLVGYAYGLVFGVDSFQLVPQATYAKAFVQGFSKAIIRGYEEACSVGGEVDPNFVGSYTNARAAGYTDIDMYWFPCNGSGNNCKSYATQLSEIAATFLANSMDVGRIWIDIGQDGTNCNTISWNYGTAGNLAQAQSLIAAVQLSGFDFGIYSSAGQWSTIFGSTAVVLNSTVPLWFSNLNNVATVALGTSFGGWTTAVGHQYSGVDASGLFDLNVFNE